MSKMKNYFYLNKCLNILKLRCSSVHSFRRPLVQRSFSILNNICRRHWRIILPVNSVTSSSTQNFHRRAESIKCQKEKKPESLQELVEVTERPETAVTVSQKVAQAGKDVSYFVIILAGFAVTGALLWYAFSELFLSSSPNKIYSDALKKVKLHEEVIDALGKPIKGYGEETSRGRRRHVSFQEYIVGNDNFMKVRFYVSGSRRKGTVHVDVKQVSSRRYEYRYIFVELDGFPSRTIIIEDNRLETG